MGSITDTPNATGRLSKALLSTLLGEPVADYETKAGSNEGDNVASVLTSVVATTTTGQTHHLLYKAFPEPDGGFHDNASEQRTLKFFTTEHLFYRTVVPLYKSVIDTHLARDVKTDCTLPFAQFYGSGYPSSDPQYLRAVWVQDLRPDGYRMLDKLDGYNLEESELILKELGKFHAITYMMVRQHGEKLFDNQLAYVKLNWWLLPEARTGWSYLFAQNWRNTMKLLEARGHDAWVEHMKKIKFEDAFDVALNTAKNTGTKYFPVLLHGDLWTNNILLKFDAQNRPIAAKFVDFQLSRRGNIYEELWYFIYTSTTPEFRAKHLTTVLASYYSSFTSFLQALNCPTPINFTLGTFLDEFNANRLAAYMYMTFAIPLQLSAFSLAEGCDENDIERQPGHEELPIEFVNLLYKMTKNSPPAMQRLEDITAEMVQFQVL